jgi:hypothetical protein
LRKADLGGEDALRAEAGVGREQVPEAAQHEAGADQQHAREADFADHQHASQADVPGSGGGARGFAQR